MLVFTAPADLDAAPPRVRVICALDGGDTLGLPGRVPDIRRLIDVFRNQFGGRVAGVEIF